LHICETVFIFDRKPGRLAQPAEQLTLNQRVTGSNPVSPSRNSLFGCVVSGGLAVPAHIVQIVQNWHINSVWKIRVANRK
jgi:hypothetical protein